MTDFREEQITHSYELNDPGKYNVEVTEVRKKTSSNGDEMWTLKFKDLKSDTFLCSDNLVFSPNAKGQAFKKITLMGIEKNDAGAYQCEPEDLIGRRCVLDLIIREYDGKKYLNPDFRGENFGYGEDVPF